MTNESLVQKQWAAGLKRLRRTWLHLLAWAAMLLFTLAAPQLHYRWFAADGRSTLFTDPLPKATTKNEFSIQRLSTISRFGEPLYRLSGWAFLTLDPALAPEDYTRRLLLHSESRSFVYPTETLMRLKLNRKFSNLPFDLRSAAFYATIAIDSLEPGSYKVYLLFSHPSGKTYLVRTPRTLTRTMNTLELK